MAHPRPKTPTDLIDKAVRDTAAHAEAWVKTDPVARMAMLDESLSRFATVYEAWASLSNKLRGLTMDSPAAAEGWISASQVVRQLRILKRVMGDITEQGRPKLPHKPITGSDGRVRVPVLPYLPGDRVLYQGISAEVWMPKGLSEGEILGQQAAAYRRTQQLGKVALVLGAGNQGLLITGDVFHKLFVENQVVVLKMHPVNAILGPLLEETLTPFVRAGVLRIVYGGADVGAHLVHHPLIDDLHMTGSDATFEAILFGSGDIAEKRKHNREPIVKKRFTAELGNVSPLIIAPDVWSKAEIDKQARSIAAMLTQNAGFNCLTPRVIITHKQWPQRAALLAAIKAALAEVPTRRAYYPGAHKRHARFTAAHPEGHQIGTPGPDHLPWTFITDVDPTNTDDICFREEAFCGLMCETALDAPTYEAYLHTAVDFANEVLWGTLTATLIAKPHPAVEEALTRLRYGTVGLNVWGALNYAINVTTWGAYPGHDIYDVQSGIGVVNNMLMLHRPIKTVLRGPFDPIQTRTLTRQPMQYAAKHLTAWEVERAPIHLLRLAQAGFGLMLRGSRGTLQKER